MATLGKTSIGAAWISISNTNEAYGCQFTLSETGTFTSITAYVDQDAGTPTCTFAITDTSGILKGYTGTTAIPAAGAWVTQDLITPVELTAGDYLLMMWASGATSYTKYDADGTGKYFQNLTGLYPNWPADASVASNSTYNLSIYATYTTGGRTYVLGQNRDTTMIGSW